jgi:hypothetical protein
MDWLSARILELDEDLALFKLLWLTYEEVYMAADSNDFMYQVFAIAGLSDTEDPAQGYTNDQIAERLRDHDQKGILRIFSFLALVGDKGRRRSLLSEILDQTATPRPLEQEIEFLAVAASQSVRLIAQVYHPGWGWVYKMSDGGWHHHLIGYCGPITSVAKECEEILSKKKI